MREILFRGKRVKDGKWVDGSLFSSMTGQKFIRWEVEDDGAIEEIVQYEVIPETVGQFTVLTDRNGKKIYEGDIFTSDYFDDTYNFEVVFNNGAFCGKHKQTGIYMLGFTNYDDNGEDLGYWGEEDYTSHIQIIGNIHDNPELLT